MSKLIHIGHQNMSEISMHVRHCMFYQCQLGNNESAATLHICVALGEGAVADRTYPVWFKRFCEDATSLEDRRRFGRPLQSDIKRIKVLIIDNPPLTTRELSTMFGCK